jgi:ribosomal protein S18 acetylase RimI-like enzyme
MPQITYRAATLDDLAALAALRWDMEAELRGDLGSRDAYVAAYTAARRADMERGACLAWIAEWDHRPIACVQLVWWAAPHAQLLHRKRGYVTGVYTAPAYRRQGVARQLLELLIAHAREHGIQRLMLYPSEMGAPLYESLGFGPSRGMELNL